MKMLAAVAVTTALAVLGLSAQLALADSPVQTTGTVVDATLTIYGGSTADQEMITGAVERFRIAELELPELEIHLHDGTDGCGGHEGYYKPSTGRDRIDLCSKQSMTALHELAHAWEHHALADSDRNHFMNDTGAGNWNDHDEPWGSRGMEIAANTVAFGLLENPANDAQITHMADDFERFETLTGTASPRL